ncbi:MoxR family ATPase [Georgenia thermotolerans]|uniref:ATPase n=1 Tax=Georgenia thermotolerans TaxID=527326 RepID=A0A7J5UML5_9MICO|nr:MoxR family ATPase [Georgenia thermotolerans]KAE8763597.1 ATPase [Georgenia thermotolerans]
MTAPTDPLRHVSASPTLPTPSPAAGGELEVEDLFRPLAAAPSPGAGTGLDEKLRQAYFWIVNHAIISPHYDVEFDAEAAGRVFRLGDSRAELRLPTAQSYSSFVLLPLLTFAVRGRCLLLGGPGRGKTASAILMGVLAGYPVREVRRAMQHGHPQLTVTDLFGTPLPKDLVSADSLADVDVAWRSWLGMRVKIVDEYNRIPTRTQSALLTVLADGYVEVYDQIYETGASAWYLTANDDAGGGTYQVVEALRDRIDVIVHALPFNSRFLGELVERAERRLRPEEAVPPEIVFTAEEHAAVHAAITALPLPAEVRRRIEFFASQLELLERAGDQFEYRTKDTARLAGADVHHIAAQDTGRDRLSDVGSSTLNGLSVRALQSLVAYAKAMAFFRGRPAVGLDDVRAVLPFVLHDKVAPDLRAPAFEDEGRAPLRTDRISWLRDIFDTACAQYDVAGLDRDDVVAEILGELHAGLDGVDAATVRARMARIEQVLDGWGQARKLYGHLYDDALALKYAHQRYTNYLTWLQWSR